MTKHRKKRPPRKAKPDTSIAPILTREQVCELIDAAVQNPAKAKQLLEATPALRTAPYIWGGTALHFLTIENYIDGVRTLADLGCPIDHPNEFGDTPLMSAAQLGYADISRLLLERGANPNAWTEEKDTVLFNAVHSKNREIVEMLLSAGADPNWNGSYWGTALLFAVKHANPEIVETLLAGGAKADILSPWGDSIWDVMREAPRKTKAMQAVLAKHGVFPPDKDDSTDPET